MVKYGVVDLFSGIGGISSGFLQAGFNINTAIDIDKKAIAIYKEVTKVENVIVEDITKIDVSDIPNSDIITASIPSTAFSLASSYKKNTEWECIVNIIECKKPKAFLIETIEATLRVTDGLIAFVESLQEFGYTVKWNVIKSVEVTGWPISEKKLYIVGINQREAVTEFIFPSISCSESKSIYTVLEQSDSIDDVYRKVYRKEEFSFKYGEFYIRQGRNFRNIKLLPLFHSRVPIVVDEVGPRYLTLGEIGILKGFNEKIFNDYERNVLKYLCTASNVEVISILAKRIQVALEGTEYVEATEDSGESIYFAKEEHESKNLQETPDSLNEWDRLINIIDDRGSNSQKKGKALEQLLFKFFSTVEGFNCVANVRTETEEIDIEIYNKSHLFIDEKKTMLCECKNWSSTVPRSELSVFVEKMKNRKGRCTVGFVVAWNGVSSKFDKELLRLSREGELVVVLGKEGIRHAIEESNVADYLEKCYREAIRK